MTGMKPYQKVGAPDRSVRRCASQKARQGPDLLSRNGVPGLGQDAGWRPCVARPKPGHDLGQDGAVQELGEPGLQTGPGLRLEPGQVGVRKLPDERRNRPIGQRWTAPEQERLVSQTRLPACQDGGRRRPVRLG